MIRASGLLTEITAYIDGASVRPTRQIEIAQTVTVNPSGELELHYQSTPNDNRAQRRAARKRGSK